MNADTGSGLRLPPRLMGGPPATRWSSRIARPPISTISISAAMRRKGCGAAVFSLLPGTLQTARPDPGVFVWNKRARAFRRSFGFAPRSILMRYAHDHD